MKKEAPDNGQQPKDGKSGNESLKQTDKPWKDHPEKEQRRSGPPPDLENWQKSNTH